MFDLPGLRAILADHAPADAQEAAHRAQMLRVADAVAAPTSRSTFAPGHFTASAFVLSPDCADLLLIFHGKLRRWLQPGGHIDPDDPDVVAAARREVAEETGLTDLAPFDPSRPILDLDVHEIPPLRGDPAHLHLDVRALFRADTRAIAAGSDAEGARWVPLGEVSAVESDASVMRAVGTIQRWLEAR